MTDEELTNLSKKLFAEVVNNIEFPPNIIVEKQDDDIYLFIQKLSNKIGTGVFYFQPELFLIKEYIKNPERLEPAFGKKLNEDMVFLIGQTILYGLLTNFHLEIEESFNNFFDYPSALMSQLFSVIENESAKNLQEANFNRTEKAKKDIDKFAKKRSKSFKQRITNQVDAVKKDIKIPNKNLLSFFYSDVLGTWKEAKKFYKQNSKYQNWEKMALLAFPNSPEDLILRLENPDPYMSMPSSIALENAARLVGFKNDSFELRTLQNYLKESRLWLKTKNEEEINKELITFFAEVSEEVIIALKVSDSLGKDFPLENYSLIHHLLFKEVIATEQGESENNENPNNEDFHWKQFF